MMWLTKIMAGALDFGVVVVCRSLAGLSIGFNGASRKLAQASQVSCMDISGSNLFLEIVGKMRYCRSGQLDSSNCEVNT